MSDTDDKPTSDPKPAADDTAEASAAEVKKWKDLARKHEDRAKASHAELEALKADKGGDASDLKQLQQRVAAAEKRAADAETEGRRFQVAAAKKLTPAQASRLRGETIEELEADADELLDAFKPPAKGEDDSSDEPVYGGKPKERLRPGAAPDAEPVETDPAKLAAMIPRM